MGDGMNILVKIKQCRKKEKAIGKKNSTLVLWTMRSTVLIKVAANSS